jgi:hypothetical protein
MVITLSTSTFDGGGVVVVLAVPPPPEVRMVGALVGAQVQ